MSLEDFERHLQDQGRSPRTVAGYARDLKGFARWFEQTNGEALAPRLLTRTDVRQYRDFMMHVEKAAPATINRRIAALHAYVDWARTSGQIDHNPLNGVKGVQKQATAPRWLNKREQAALRREAERAIAAATAPAATPAALRQAIRDHAILLTLLHTGLRVGELCALELADLKLGERKGLVTVRNSKREKSRDVPLNQTVREALRQWLAVRPPVEARLVFVGKRTARDAAGEEPAGMTPSAVQRRLAELGRRAGVEVTPHTLRHTFIKNLLNEHVAVEKVAALAGHKNIQTTLDYGKPSFQELEQAVEGLAD